MPLRTPDSSRKPRLAIGLGLPVLAGMLLLCACTPDRGVRRDDVRQCMAPDSAECAAARERFQVVRYPTMSADQLVAASSRALGDLNFEADRDDAQGRVSGSYIASAPTHEKQLDLVFKRNLKSYGAAQISAQVQILRLPDQDTGADVRLRLYAAIDGAAPSLIDSVALYQIFFSQLGFELGAPAAPPPEDKPQDRRRPVVPSISGI
jgi:hypothetical protein